MNELVRVGLERERERVYTGEGERESANDESGEARRE